MAGLQTQLEGLNTDAHAVEINGLWRAEQLHIAYPAALHVPEAFGWKSLMTHRKIPLSLQALAGSAFK